MTRDEADKRAAELNAEGNGNWFVRETADGGFEAVRVNVPGMKPVGPLNASIESDPRPPDAEDPRTTYDKNVGGPWAV